jgi:DNA-binding CsgD family transcriptional regulator
VLDIAVVVFDGGGRLVFSNPVAQRVLAEGASVQIAEGRVRGSPEDSAALLAAVRECTAGLEQRGHRPPPPRCFRVSRAERPPLIVSLSAIRLTEAGRLLPLAVGVIQDPEARTSLEPADLTARYGLTPAESRVAAAICDGKVAKVVARDLDIGLATVRTHLKSIYVKLGVRNAKELIALLRGSVFHYSFNGGS